KRAYRICRAGGSVLRVLVIVEKNAVTLFLPPFRTGQRGSTALHRARQRDGRAPHLRKTPARLDADIDVNSTTTTGLGPATQSHRHQKTLHFQRDARHVGPSDTWD